MEYPIKRKRHMVWEYDKAGLPVRKVARFRERYEWRGKGAIYTAPVSEAGKAILDRRRVA